MQNEVFPRKISSNQKKKIFTQKYCTEFSSHPLNLIYVTMYDRFEFLSIVSISFSLVTLFPFCFSTSMKDDELFFKFVGWLCSSVFPLVGIVISSRLYTGFFTSPTCFESDRSSPPSSRRTSPLR